MIYIFCALIGLLLSSDSLMAQLATERMSYPKALAGRYEQRQDLPDWLRVPRWCTTDAPRWAKGDMAALINGYADRHANLLRLGTFWGGVAMYPSQFAPRSPSLKDGTDPLAEAIATVRQRHMRILAYINPNAYREQNPLYKTACLMDESGKPWDQKAYGMTGTRYACIVHPAFAQFYTQAIREVVGKYGADGIYVDGLSPHVCYCEHCKQKFKADTGRELPAGLTNLGPLGVLWEMTSDWDIVGDVQNPDHVLYSRWLMKCLRDLTQLFAETTKSVNPRAVVVFHTWPKPDTMKFYDATLNEIYAKKPWNFTLWKRAEFSNWGDVFEVPSLVNIYLRQETWGGEKRKVTSEVEARHMFWQALANGGFPNAWEYRGMERPFEVMERHADCFDFSLTVPTKFLALPRPMFSDARHRKIQTQRLLPLTPGKQARLRILEREPNGKIDLLCLRADDRQPTDEEYQEFARGKSIPDVIYIKAAAFDPTKSVISAEGRTWKIEHDPKALSGMHLIVVGGGITIEPQILLEYALPPITSAGPWALWARVIFPNAASDSFFWQVSNDGGQTWIPPRPCDECALGWEQPQEYAWVKARTLLTSDTGERVDRFLSPGAGMFAGLLHAGLPVKQMHPNHITRQSLEGFRVLVLANELCLSDEQCEMIRQFVREGGALIATHETSLYNLECKRRNDFGLADVFGASLIGEVHSQKGQVIVADTGHLPNHEMHIAVTPQGAQVVATLNGPGVPQGGVPAMLFHEFGKGRAVYLPGRLDSSYSLWGDKAFPSLLISAIMWACKGEVPVRVISPAGLVGVTCFDQPSRSRRLIHLLSYNADWVQGFDQLPALSNVRVLLRAPEGKKLASARAILSGETLTPSISTEGIQLLLPRLEEYEVIEVKWEDT